MIDYVEFQSAIGLNWYDVDPNLQFLMRRVLDPDDFDWSMRKPGLLGTTLIASLLILLLNSRAGAQTCNQNSTLPRPIPMGVSGNINTQCRGGTLGTIVQNSGGTHFILATSHDFGRCNFAKLGEGVVQPGVNQVNCQKITNDIVEYVSKYTTISVSGTNFDHSGIAKAVSGDTLSSHASQTAPFFRRRDAELPVSVVSNACSNSLPLGAVTSSVQSGPTQDQLAAEDVVTQDGGSLLTVPGVFQVGVGTDNNGSIMIVVTAEALTPEIQSQIPSTLGGFQVRLEQGPRSVFY